VKVKVAVAEAVRCMPYHPMNFNYKILETEDLSVQATRLSGTPPDRLMSPILAQILLS
jgi:hypothetical protein